MKSIKRKLLSLLLAMAMVCSLVPTALAEGEDDTSPGDDDQTIEITDVIIKGAGNDQDVKGSYSLSASVNPENATAPITYTWSVASGDINISSTSGDSITVSCKNTTSTSNVEGTVKCTAAQGSVTKDTTATVSFKGIPAQAPVATEIEFSGNSATLDAGKSMTVTATPQDANGVAVANATVTWDCGTLPTGITATKSGNRITITAAENLASNQTVTVTATVDGTSPAVTGTFTVSVKAAAKSSASLTVNYSSISVKGTAALTVSTTNLTAGTDYDSVSWSASPSGIVSLASSTTTLTNTVEGLTSGTATITASLMKNGQTVCQTNSVTIKVTVPELGIEITPYTGYSSYYNASSSTFTSVNAYATAKLVNVPDNISAYNITWTLSPANSTVITLSNNTGNAQLITIMSNTSGSVTLTATLTGTNLPTYTASKTIYVSYAYQLTPSVTVYRSDNYNLADTDINNNRSILQQITAGITGVSTYPYVMFTDNSVTGGTLTARLNYPYFLGSTVPTGVTGGLLSDIDFVPSSSSTATKAEFRFTLYYYNGVSTSSSTSQYSGLMTFNISGEASTGDIAYTASIGDDVSFVLGDFEDFYYTKTKGTLNYVSFTLPSGGSLYSDRGRLTTSNACYASPSGTQADLGGVYFTPTGTTATRASTVRISFTAYGSRSSATGTVAITYLSGTAKDITYNISVSGALKASDFTDAYKAVVGSTAPTGLTIQFQSVPTNGTLTYKDSSRTSSSTVTLKSSNIKSYNFTTRTTGSNQLGDVTYTASGTKSDTIEYIAYVNSTPQFTGKVVFNGTSAATTNMLVAKSSIGGAAVTFSYTDFYSASATVMASCSYIRITSMPTGGTLTYNGTAVALASTNITATQLGSLVYRPNSTFNNNTDRFSFTCYDAKGNTVGSGQASIVVTGNTSGSSAATTVSNFKDVSSTAWYRADLITLVDAGIIQGRGDGNFDPTAELTYGEALKIFMLASGYPAQAETSGKDWAINYKNLAVSNGWISSSVNLSDKISRNQMAELAARSLGLSSSSASAPWSDGTANGYAVALYYTSPQILIGNADGTFKGTSTLLRQEICAIASRILTYRAIQDSLEKPGWLG